MNVSVVIPLYNKEEHIYRCLESIAQQSCPPSEVILIDDGSTDQSLSVVNEFSQIEITVVTQANSGVSAARNHGIRIAKYEWIALLDADDEWSVDFLKKVREALLQNPQADVCFTNYTTAVKQRAMFSCEAVPEVSVVDNYYEFCLAHRGFGMTSSSVVSKRDFLLCCGGFPTGRQSGEDLDTWFRMGAYAHEFVYISRPLVHYNNGLSGLTVTEPLDMDVWGSYKRLAKQNAIPLLRAKAAKELATFYRMRTAFVAFKRFEIIKASGLIQSLDALSFMRSTLRISGILCSRFFERIK